MLAWKGYGPNYMNLIKEQSSGLTTERKLDAFNWSLGMPIAQSGVESSKLGDVMPNARSAVAELSFDVGGDVSMLRMTKTQLQGFYEELEKIQMKVDELTK